MVTKRDIKILTELLDLEEVKVISHRLHDGIGIILQTEPIKSYSLCPHCGTKSFKLHQNHRHIVKDLSFGENPVFLEINRRQFKCETCKKPFSEELDFVRKKRTYTTRLAKKTIQEVLDSDIHTIASKGIVTTEEIERMLKDASSELPNLKPLNLKRLGLDEIALIKGKGNYCAVLVDLDTSKLITILSDVYDGLRLRSQETIKKTLIEWGSELLGQIEEVSIDLWKGYKTLVIELMPNAQVVADRFHVMTQINNELDTQRKREKRNVEELIRKTQSSEKAEHEKILEGLKKSKYVLLKNEKDLSEEQINKLIQIKRTTSGTVEGINNKLKLIKRSAYGFRNFENFRVRCLLNWHFNFYFSITSTEEPVLFNLKIGNYIRSDYKKLVNQHSVDLHCLIVIDLIDFVPPIISDIT